MATRGSLEWLNGILATPGFNPYSPEGQDLLNNTPRDSEAFKNLMLRQQMQVAKTGGDISNTEWWKNDPTQANAQDQSIAMSRWGDLNRQSQAFEDSEKANNGDMSMLRRAIMAAAAAYGVGNFAFGSGMPTSGLDISGGLDGPAFELGPNPTGVGTGNAWQTASGVSDTGYGAGKVAAGMTPEEAAILNNGAIAESLYVPTAGEISAAFPTAAVAKAGAQTALQRILSGSGTASDYAELGLRALPGVLGAFGASQQSSKLGDLASRFASAGAPSAARYEASFAPGFTMASDPGFTDALDMASKANLHALSTGGNPAGSPNAQQQNMSDLYSKYAYPALQTYRSQALNASGITNMNAATPGAMTGQIGSNAGVYNGIGSAIGSVVNPPTSLADILKQYQSNGDSIFKVAA